MNRVIKWIGLFPHLALWVSIPIVLLIGWVNRSTVIDVQIHDTYTVVGVFSIAIFAGIYFGLLSGLYYAYRNLPLAGWMNVVHVLGSIVFVFILVIYQRGEDPTGLGFTRIDGVSLIEKLSNGLEHALPVAVMIFLFIQLVFMINMTIAVFESKRIFQ